MKATAVAPANIAFIKYWGKRDENLRLPLNSSISMNLSGAYSTTCVDFSPTYLQDEIGLIGGTFSQQEKLRIIQHLDRIRQTAGNFCHAKVVTQNTFPKGTGVAASASGFAALTLAAASALGIKLSEKELTILARLGSGSACRSIPDGFVEWLAGKSSEDSYARSLFPANWWELRDILLIVTDREKAVSTTHGMRQVRTSPFLDARLKAVPARIVKLKTALQKKDLRVLGKIIEEDCLEMHQVMQTQDPPLNYWNEVTREIMGSIRKWRKKGLEVYFTIDAGPNVHLICESSNEVEILKRLKYVKGIQCIIVNKPAEGARLISHRLF